MLFKKSVKSVFELFRAEIVKFLVDKSEANNIKYFNIEY